VGQLVQTELSQILHSGLIKGYDVEGLDDELRQRISIVRSDVSPDLRQARISVSVRAAAPRNDNNDSSSSPAVDRRRAYAWLVRHSKQLRYTLAQRLSHMKSCPSLTFAQVDVSAAVDVMYLIDKLSADGNFKRQNLHDNNEVARGMVGGMDFDEELFDDDDDDDDDDEEDGDWDEADDFFQTK
jgi:ribosome-binding factor A